MIDLASLSEPVQALALVGIVLVEAIILYVGYGALEQVTKPLVKRITQA